ncbi:hypothetical protein HAX54_003376 [Datura stramonium]|uniref:Uncharacterized protein n=1 Tax=Datura stramonium TaxID=4076 RepID=A0ABS8T7H3_DATST|nr:hypothetical protein [Datura stramonium]
MDIRKRCNATRMVERRDIMPPKQSLESHGISSTITQKEMQMVKGHAFTQDLWKDPQGVWCRQPTVSISGCHSRRKLHKSLTYLEALDGSETYARTSPMPA